MKTVCLAIPPVDELYPWKSARAGLEAMGLQVIMGGANILDADFLVTWSPWNGSRRQALQFNYARAGKPVIVMENGWLSPIGGGFKYQVAFDGWNGTGRFHAGIPARWNEWVPPMDPWTDRRVEKGTGFALIIGQRGHSSDDRTAPPDWHTTFTPDGIPPRMIFRRGPEAAVMRSIGVDIHQAAECHVWSSNAASWALLCGVPVVQHGPNLMVGALASRPGEPLIRPERTPEFQRLAWAQWAPEEIAAGEPFKRLLDLSRLGLT